jgi:hypothetical protein
MGDVKSAYKIILVGELEGKWPLGRPRRTRRVILSESQRDSHHLRLHANTAMNLRVTWRGNFLSSWATISWRKNTWRQLIIVMRILRTIRRVCCLGPPEHCDWDLNPAQCMYVYMWASFHCCPLMVPSKEYYQISNIRNEIKVPATLNENSTWSQTKK